MAAMAEEEPPVTRDEVRGWFDDLEFTHDTAFSLILDQAEQQYRCEFQDGMSKEAKSIHDWLYEKWVDSTAEGVANLSVASPQRSSEGGAEESPKHKSPIGPPYPRPRGPTPRGKKWDKMIGEWVPDGTENQVASPQGSSKVRYSRPRGPAPRGKKWDYTIGKWISDGTGNDVVVRGPSLPDMRRRYTIVQWNMKGLTYFSDKKDIPRAEKRIDNITDTLKKLMGGQTPFAACIMQEVNPRGRISVAKITEKLNEFFPKVTFRCEFSGIVDPKPTHTRGGHERFAIIWNETYLGPLMGNKDKGYRLTSMGFFEEGRSDPDEFLIDHIGSTPIDLESMRFTWESIAAYNRCEPPFCFDRMPVLFTFHPPKFEKEFHILAAHSATMGSKRYKGDHYHQNVVESSCLQEICNQAASKGEYMIMLGDFNVAECETMYIWDDKKDITNCLKELKESDLNEKQLLGGIKEQFFRNYKRCIDKDLPTNLFPYLAGDKSAKHNDDIWMPLKMECPLVLDLHTEVNETLTGDALMKKIDQNPGKVHSIPSDVLKQWEYKTRKMFYEEQKKGSEEAKEEITAKKVNAELYKLWSDHRPVSVRLAYSPSSRSKLSEKKELYKLVQRSRIFAKPTDIFKYTSCLVTNEMLADLPPQPEIADDGPSIVQTLTEEEFIWEHIKGRADFKPDVFYIDNGNEKRGIEISGDEVVESVTFETVDPDELPEPENRVVLTLTKISPCTIEDYSPLEKYFKKDKIDTIRTVQFKEYLSYEVLDSMLKVVGMDGSETEKDLWDALQGIVQDPTREVKIFFEGDNTKAHELVEQSYVPKNCGKIGCACDLYVMYRIENMLDFKVCSPEHFQKDMK
tara:strand:+ start:2850 stop:5408 length:2559 start_codon:yes stop_codon:yes gene_type:complete